MIDPDDLHDPNAPPDGTFSAFIYHMGGVIVCCVRLLAHTLFPYWFR